MKKILLRFVLLILSAIVVIKAFHFDTDNSTLNIFAERYFNEDYYLEHYPEVKALDITPFEHYVTIGWKENKNPSASFDNEFYVNMYLLQNKYSLNPLADYFRSNMSFKKRYTKPGQLKKTILLESPKYYLSLVAIFQNEARFLKEWIEFYRMIGVEHFYLYNHLSTDNYQEVLEPYIEAGIVDLMYVTERPKSLPEWNKIQVGAYSKTAREVSDITEWLVVVDTDEFLFPVNGRSLADALKEYDEYASLSVNWKIFGSSGVEHIAENELMIERLQGSNPKPDSHVKTIVKPRYVVAYENPHYPVLKDGYAQINENFEYFWRGAVPAETRHKFRINHYWARDLEFYRLRKMNRVHIKASGTQEEIDSKMAALYKRNEELSAQHDDSILKYVEELSARMGY
ncbi:glycosyltransferase family 92 protein [Rickettsiaceae bacterium]|nr:glycosyltransferase family 92 protein [Rickettsiaceae bacterium]